MKKGFTLIELIFVIVILSIISMFGANLYTKIYKSYSDARTMSGLQFRTDTALLAITSRLENRIKDSLIGRKSADNSFVGIDSVAEDHDILEWIGQSVESKNLGTNNPRIPGWSGFIDLQNPRTTRDTTSTTGAGTLISNGSNIPEALRIIQHLTGENSFGVVFKGSVVPDIQNAFGFDVNTHNCTNVAQATAATDPEEIRITNFENNNSKVQISNQYYLAHTAYAVVPENITQYTSNGQNYNQFDLVLRYDYQPWRGQTYLDGRRALIARNVTMFRFKDENGAVALKLCIREDKDEVQSDDVDSIVCKSQVVY